MTKKNITYDEAIQELEQLVEDMENENIGIDELSMKVRRASALIEICREKLLVTEQEIHKILTPEALNEE
ncbi:MAG: exodeoxyribonuclease VII small subunit [Bacteroidales bacterium]|nr:exodeoxyribonuclease VII small subunit [Bacteroidales bacterium]MDD2323171.1 exodeoxyribonuclease VII small subunit [Bacteroidales bacterium]MDD3010318.1 exodeoxyribonuclease VII small subunit [Bacteroidales bacterium]MDD3961207.1 exodeoxyribonuclease VII small subunit [Bacteroidales bacterium]MDY0284631.1 exodeoxyribonuclease VII small subunit [Bacteroidales bacterium]